MQLEDGSEAYTRHGSLKLSENGLLQTASGLNVSGEDGPISIPPDTRLAIGGDGTISATESGPIPGEPLVLGRLKLTNPEEAALVRGDDGLFRLRDGGVADTDENVRVLGGAIEGSNVNVVEAMVYMICLARQFDLHMSLLKNAESNAAKAGQLLSLT